MNIYQIHKSGGCYEDHYDYIVFSYFDYSKAVAKKEELEAQELIERKCNECPLEYCNDKYCNEDCANCFEEKRMADAMKYCDKCELKYTTYEYDEEPTIRCVNKVSHWEDNYFRIEEVEVIE
jgi:hypothetical protein